MYTYIIYSNQTVRFCGLILFYFTVLFYYQFYKHFLVVLCEIPGVYKQGWVSSGINLFFSGHTGETGRNGILPGETGKYWKNINPKEARNEDHAPVLYGGIYRLWHCTDNEVCFWKI